MPFEISAKKMNRGDTFTLDEKQSAFFSGATGWGEENTTVKQMLKLNGDDGNSYYMNVNTGDVYTEDFVKNGYKNEDKFDPATQRIGNLTAVTDPPTAYNVSENFDQYGVIKEGAAGSGVGTDYKKKITVDGKDVNLKLSTTEQYIVKYAGDDKYISMVKKNGGVDKATDTVNVTGQDINGCDLFDVGKDPHSGTARLNQLLYTVAKMDAADYKWAGEQGMTIADSAHATVLGAQTKMAARQQAYNSSSSMLVTQNESITSDISDVSSTDVAQLATKLMEYQTIYSLSLSVGSKILPGTLADYL